MKGKTETFALNKVFAFVFQCARAIIFRSINNCFRELLFFLKIFYFFFLTRDGRSLKAVKENAPSFGNVLFLHIYIKMRISGPLNTFSNSS